MKRTIVVLAMATMVANATLFAQGMHKEEHHKHSGHDKELRKSEIQQVAKTKVDLLVKEKKIQKSWKDASLVETRMKEFKNRLEWIVSFENKTIQEKKREMLLIFLNMKGEVLGVKYSGK